MNIEARKILFVQEFLRLQNEDLISVLEKMLYQQNSATSKEDFKPMELQAFSEQIDRAEADAAAGRTIKAAELKKKVKQWQ